MQFTAAPCHMQPCGIIALSSRLCIKLINLELLTLILLFFGITVPLHFCTLTCMKCSTCTTATTVCCCCFSRCRCRQICRAHRCWCACLLRGSARVTCCHIFVSSFAVHMWCCCGRLVSFTVTVHYCCCCCDQQVCRAHRCWCPCLFSSST